AETKGIAIPDMEFCTMVKDAVQTAVPVAEGGIHTYEELSSVLKTGIDHVVIGGAITRPQNITRGYVRVFAETV
ncbi:MAG: N-acetylmannosamine-6-phosphate 2-epimerase, partial [Clostridia bacterium]|nr:N-acetylmannosamine-6-phosphate 2-epimerase [Clostridia bacterium]